MNTMTRQLESWTGEFGRAYTDRNFGSPQEMDEWLAQDFGIHKSDLFRQFLSTQQISSGRVLEVGCNIGLQLRLLGAANPNLELYGLDPQAYALAKGRELSPMVNFIPGSAFDLPFKDGYFDVVMTNNVLIHIHPADLPAALAEIYRSSGQYIFLSEYFSEKPCEVNYRGNQGLLWKMNYMQRYLDLFPSLRCVQVRYLSYPSPDGQSEVTDQVCLLEKDRSQ